MDPGGRVTQEQLPRDRVRGFSMLLRKRGSTLTLALSLRERGLKER
jgi:hypothetical protein